MNNKFFVQINTDLDFADVLEKLNTLEEENFKFKNLNSDVEWLLCETFVDTCIEKTVDTELKPLFIEHRDGLVSRVYTSDIVDYSIAIEAIDNYDFEDMEGLE